MQSALLMFIYLMTIAAVQMVGFGISRAVDVYYPTLGLMTFLVLFMVAFGVAWPIAVRITEWLIVVRGGAVEQQDPRAR
jgi:uncharacterized membrane protein YkvI